MDKNQRIAIVGVGGMFPGAADLAGFWENILKARDCAREPPPGRWLLSLEDVYDASGPQADKVYSRRACFVETFSPDISGMAIKETFLAGLDPMFQLLLHAGNQAWRDARTSRLDRRQVGVIIGNIALPTEAASAFADEIILPVLEKQIPGKQETLASTDPLNRYVAGLPAGILARALGLGGGSYTLDAACASSLYALKYAMDELQSGRRDAMLCGGLSRPDSLYTQMGFSALHALSASGRCAPFDQQSDGLVVGEGAGILILKRLQDALVDGDHIYATIAGIGLSNDIGGNLMLPDSEGQLRAMRAAYRQANWQASDVDLIECHGTGTPVGDAVEFNSLNSLWSAERQAAGCVIGSVKSNIGHLLTAAGVAGLIKVLLAMRHETLPPTANYRSAASGIAMEASPFTVLSAARPWRRRNDILPRRAAISAFGFGGINAHVLLEQWDAAYSPSGSSPESPVPHSVKTGASTTAAIAIVGMDAWFGPWQGLQAFRHRVLGANEERQPTQINHCKSEKNAIRAYTVDRIDVPLGRFRIPPNELKDMLPQQLLMLQVAADAIANAGIADEKPACLQSAGVYIGTGLDLNTTNFHLRWCLLYKARRWAQRLGLELSEAEFESWAEALGDASVPAMNANRTMGALGGIVASRIARAFAIGGPSLTVANEESSGLRALEAGMRALQRGEINVAVVGAVDLASDIRAVSGLQARAGSSDNRDLIVSDGAAAVILKRYDDAQRDGDRIYAVINAVGAACGGDASACLPDAESYAQAVKRCCLEAGVTLESIGLVEAHGSAIAAESALESTVIRRLFRHRRNHIPCAISSVKSDTGHSGAAAALASVIKASLCLHQRLLPAMRNSETLPVGGDNDNTLFAPPESHYWLRDREQGPRRVLVNSFSVDGNSISVILQGVDDVALAPGCSPVVEDALFSICADDEKELSDSLQRLAVMARASTGRDIHALAADWWRQAAATQDGSRAVSILAADSGQLSELLAAAQTCVEQGESIAGDRLFYAARPLAEAGKLAFVFPGSGSHFIGMGREMSVRWPTVLEHQDTENRALASQFADGRFWTSGDTARFTHEDFIFAQVWLGALVSDVIAGFALKPDAVIGYCLGESVGLFATRTWSDRDRMLQRMRETRLFTHDLGGSCEAARQCWGVAADERIDWQLGVVDRPAKAVRQALEGRSRVYLLIINTPDECVIGGDRTAVQALVRDLECGFHPLEGVTTVHCEVVKPVQAAYRELHVFATTPPQGVAFYSGIAGSRYQVTTASAADSIVQQALQTFDYIKLINTAYEDGIRVFIEMGPGASCSRMIGRILGKRRHIARSACVNGQSDVGNVLRILAQLNAERVPLDLGSLYRTVQPGKIDTRQQLISIPVGKKPLLVPMPAGGLPAGSGQADKQAGRQQQVRPIAAVVSRSGVNRQDDLMTRIVDRMQAVEAANAATQEVFLRVANGINATLAQAISTQMAILEATPDAVTSVVSLESGTAKNDAGPVYDRNMCMEFATGSIGKILGGKFVEVDTYPTRVRLPDEPLMLVDRIIALEGEAGSMTHGRVVTEHDVHKGAWYLDAGRVPTCIAVEAGQADLFLSGFLGIDLQTRGRAVYRLLDAEVCFHSTLPRAGQVICYDIHIDYFFRQGATWLFHFHFTGSVDGQALISMRNGCAGFFTQAELAAGKGIVLAAMEQQHLPGKRPPDWQYPVPVAREAYDDAQIAALRRGDLGGCFGKVFAGLPLNNPAGLPGGRMTLVHRILSLDPEGGRFGLGSITGEADIHADDWFLRCHFVDDQVMPGTLMYECCLHTLRVYLLRIGWVGEADEFVYEPVVGVSSKLKCRGQVLASSKKVRYEITLKEIAYAGGEGTPYVIADALMYGDGRPIVQMSNMSLQLSGLDKQRIHDIWSTSQGPAVPGSEKKRAAIFDYAAINAFAVGKPSDAFGEPYRVFDTERVIARLPGPPFQFLDRITAIDACEPWRLQAGGVIEAEYDVPANAWYFAADRQESMPFSILLEVALQPCGWLAAYLGSALTSDVDMSFRNLGGTATQLQSVGADAGTLTSKIRITNVALSGGMIIQNYDFAVRSAQGVVYAGDTYFGFFSKAALADQVGIRDVQLYTPKASGQAPLRHFPYPENAPFPDAQMRMIHRIDYLDLTGGPRGLGFVCGTADVDPNAWFFKAHFYQDPVWPGSLGLESFLQLLKLVAQQRWEGNAGSAFQCMLPEQTHTWLYRGQIIPTDERVTVEAVITGLNDQEHWLKADGYLSVDGRIIYQMNDFTLKMTLL